MFIHIALLLYCCVYLSIKQLFPLYMCICSLACCPSRALDWLIKYYYYYYCLKSISTYILDNLKVIS